MRPGLQGQGLGSALLNYAETLYAETRADVSNFRPNVIQFYQKRGYRSDRVKILIHFPLTHLQKVGPGNNF